MPHPPLPPRPRFLGQQTDALSSLATNIGRNDGQVGSYVGQVAVSLSRHAYMTSAANIAGVIVSAGMVSAEDRQQFILCLALVFVAMEGVLLPFVLPWIHKQGRGVSSASEIDIPRRDYDSLRSFYDTKATGAQLVQHVLKRTKGKDLSDPAFDTVRAAIERCRIA